MARKPRDYKAEYARAKQRATQSGYKSEREYKAVRKALNLPRGVAPIPKRILERNTDVPIRQTAADWAKRRDAQRWSNEHSRQSTSRYDPRWSSESVDKYTKAFVNERERGKDDWKRAIYDLFYQDVEDAPDYDEWAAAYFDQ